MTINVQQNSDIRKSSAGYQKVLSPTMNCATNKPIKRIIILAKCYVYECKLQGSMPELSVFQTIRRSRYNIENYVSFVLRKNFDFKMQWISYKTLAE